MATSPITSSSSSSTTDQSAAYAALTTNDFTKIIINELQHQDPLKPNDTNTLVQELSTLRNIQSSSDLSTKLGDLVNQTSFSTAAGLIGKTVSGLDESNTRTTGVVKSVSKTDTGAVLNLTDGTRLPFKTVDELDQDAAATP